MEMVKCNACGWLGEWEQLEAHFCGEHEIPICPACNSAKIEDIEIEDKEASIPF